MTTAAPWKCPDCLTWIAPHVAEHRCEPPSAGVAAPLTVTPCGPSAGTSLTFQLNGGSGLEQQFWTWFKAGIRAQGGDPGTLTLVPGGRAA